MDYARELKNLLRTLGIYDVENGIGAAELDGIGKVFNDILGILEQGERESNPLTAEDIGLAVWEELLPFVPAYLTKADRQRAIAALMQIDDASFTAAALNQTLSGCGIRAKVEETEEPMTVAVSFPFNRGRPDNAEDIQKRIEEILPCHLAVKYLFLFATWAELMALFASWAEIERGAYTWHMLECAGGEE